MSADEIFILKKNNKSIPIRKICELCGNKENSLKLMSPGEFNCVQLRICMLDELLNPKKHFFLCEDCRVVILPCTASLKILAIARALSKFEPKKGCFLCGSRKCVKQFNVTDEAINETIIYRFSQEYSFMTETKEKICKSCDEFYVELQEVYKLVFTKIKPKDGDSTENNVLQISCDDTHKEVIKDFPQNTKPNSNDTKISIKKKCNAPNSEVDREELYSKCDESIKVQVHSQIRRNTNKIVSSCNNKLNQTLPDTVNKPQVNVKSNISQTISSKEDFDESKSEPECKSSSLLVTSVQITDKYHNSKTKYPRKLPSLDKTSSSRFLERINGNLEVQDKPTKKHVRFNLNEVKHIPDDYNLYTKRENASDKLYNVKPLRSCLKTTTTHLGHQTVLTNDLLETTSSVKKQPMEAWQQPYLHSGSTSSKLSEENLNSISSSSSSIVDYSENLNKTKTTLKPHFQSMLPECSDNDTLKNNGYNHKQDKPNTLLSHISKPHSKKMLKEIQPHYRLNIEEDQNSLNSDSEASESIDQDLESQTDEDSKECISSESNTDSDKSNTSSHSDNEQKAKSTDSNFSDEDVFLCDPINEEEMLRKQEILNKSLNTTSVHGLLKLLKSVNCSSEVPSQTFDLKTYFADTDGSSTTSETMSIEDNKQIIRDLRKDADTLVYRRRRSCYDDIDDTFSDSDTPYQTKSLINYNLTSNFKVNSSEPLFILASYKDSASDTSAKNMHKVKRLQKYKPKLKACQFPPRNDPRVNTKKNKVLDLEKSTLCTSESLWLDSSESFIELVEFKEREAEMIKKSAGITYTNKDKMFTNKNINPTASTSLRLDPLDKYDPPTHIKWKNAAPKLLTNEPKKLFIKKDAKVTPPSSKTFSTVSKETIPCTDTDDILNSFIESAKQKICKQVQNFARNYSTKYRNRIKSAERSQSIKRIIVGDKEIYLNTAAVKSNVLDSNEPDITVLYKPKSVVTPAKENSVTNTSSQEANCKLTSHDYQKKTFNYKVNSTAYNTKYIPKIKRNENVHPSYNYFARRDMSMEEMFQKCSDDSVHCNQPTTFGTYYRHGDSDDSENF